MPEPTKRKVSRPPPYTARFLILCSFWPFSCAVFFSYIEKCKKEKQTAGKRNLLGSLKTNKQKKQVDSDCLLFVHFSVNRMVLVLVQRYSCWSLGLNSSRLSFEGWRRGDVQQSWFNIDSLLSHSRPQLRTELVHCLPTNILQSLTWVKSSTDYIQSVRQDWLDRQMIGQQLVWKLLLFEVTRQARKMLKLVRV